MKKKTAYALTAAVLVAVSGLIVYREWTKPYKLPELKDALTLTEAKLDFAQEQRATADTALQQGDRAWAEAGDPARTTEADAPAAYRYALSRLNQAASAQDLSIRYLMAAVKVSPDQYAYSNTLRIKMRELSETDTFIRFMGEQKPTSKVRLQTALAYVDLLQNPDLGTSLLGQKSSESIKMLDQLIEENPYDVLARYARGLNNLYWPRGLRRSERAIQDLSYCLAIEHRLGGEKTNALWPLIYEALGDAQVKNGEVAKGIKVWKEGAAKYPDSEPLQRRAQSDEPGALALVRKERGIDGFTRPDPGISDISILWTGPVSVGGASPSAKVRGRASLAGLRGQDGGAAIGGPTYARRSDSASGTGLDGMLYREERSL